MVKNIILILIISVLIVLGLYLSRRSGPPPPPPGSGMPPLPPDGERLRLRKGVIVKFSNNAHLDVNAVELKTGEEGNITVEFRPHTARLVMDIAAVGDEVAVSTGSRPNDEYIVYQLHRIENLSTHRSADLDLLPPPPDVPPGYTAENFTVDHPHILTDPYGGIDAIRDGALLFHFKPGLVDDIAGLIKTASSITMSAVRRSEDFGFVNINHDKVYIVLSVTIANKTFLVR